jgi:hypothetical protein
MLFHTQYENLLLVSQAALTYREATVAAGVVFWYSVPVLVGRCRGLPHMGRGQV